MTHFPVGRIIQWLIENCPGASVTYDGMTDNVIVSDGEYGFVVTRAYVQEHHIVEVYGELRAGFKALKERRSTPLASIRPIDAFAREWALPTAFDAA
jgi:hypothetical protein